MQPIDLLELILSLLQSNWILGTGTIVNLGKRAETEVNLGIGHSSFKIIVETVAGNQVAKARKEQA